MGNRQYVVECFRVSPQFVLPKCSIVGHLVISLQPESDLEYTANTTHVLTVDALDASELASHTNSVPVYQVVDDPKYSQIFVQSNITGNRSNFF